MSPNAGKRTERGRVETGTLVMLAVVLVAAAGAVLFLIQLGVLGSSEQPVAVPPAPVATPSETFDGPAWLAEADRELPPAAIAADEREPASLMMQNWVWEFVDDDWAVTVHRAGDGDGITYLTDFQVLFLESPEGELFRLWDLRTDYVIDVVHWDPADALTWLIREGRPGIAQVVQLDLVSGETLDTWAGSAVGSANNVPGGVGNVLYVGRQPDGRELWGAYDESGLTTGVFWRNDDGTFSPSLITPEIRRLRLQGYSDDHGVDAWVDVEAMTAVYRGTFRSGGTIDRQVWLAHDLATDQFRETSPQLPSGADCRAPGGLDHEPLFDGDLIIADCGNAGMYAIDPSGDQGPEQR